MHEAGAVRLLERAGDVDEPAEAARERHVGVGGKGSQRGADHVLHGQVQAPLRLADVVDAYDVGMAERRNGAGLAEQPRRELADHAIGVAERFGCGGGHHDHLQRDGPLETRVERLVDLPHTALAEKAADLVGSDEVTRFEHVGSWGAGDSHEREGKSEAISYKSLARLEMPWYRSVPFRYSFVYGARLDAE